MAKLTNSELKTLWLQGTVQNIEGDVLSFEDMCFQYKTGNDMYLYDGDNVTTIKAPLPKWMVWGALVMLPTLGYLADAAMHIAGY